MSGFEWFEMHPPRDMALEDAVAVLRPLAHRRPRGLMADTPPVVLELWSERGKVSWRLGLGPQLAHRLPSQMAAQLPRLATEPMLDPERPALTLAADLSMDSVASPLRADTAGGVVAGLLNLMQSLRRRETAVLQWIIGPCRQRKQRPAEFDLGHAMGLRARREPDATAARLWRDKNAEALFACRGRVGAYAPTPERAQAIVLGLADAVRLVNTASAGLRVGRASAAKAAQLRGASIPLSWSCLLNAAELATVVGLPIEPRAVEALDLASHHNNPAPRALLIAEDADYLAAKRVLGDSVHAAQRGELVTVPPKTSLHHVHVAGPTGSGKSTLLAHMILGDIAAGHGVLVVEPRGDLVHDILARIPDDRRDDVVVIDPASSDRVIGLNPLAGDPAEAERRADDILHLLSELHGGNLGPRSTDHLQHATLAASRLPDGTVADVLAVLTNAAFRRSVVAQVGDPLIIGPWAARLNALSDAERNQHIGPLQNKLGPLIARDGLRRMLSQADPLFRLDGLFTKPGMVVLVNLNRGLLGTPTANLLGALLLSQVWSAIQRRAVMRPTDRFPVMATIDEFHDYLRTPGGMDFGDALAQSRGVGVGWTLAHQHMDQLTPSQQAAVTANARSKVVFRPSTSDAKALASVIGGGVSGADLLSLKAFEACCQLHVDGEPTRPFTVRTRPLPPWTTNPDALRRQVIGRYGVDGQALDDALLTRWNNTAQASTGPIGFKRRSTP